MKKPDYKITLGKQHFNSNDPEPCIDYKLVDCCANCKHSNFGYLDCGTMDSCYLIKDEEGFGFRMDYTGKCKYWESN